VTLVVVAFAALRNSGTVPRSNMTHPHVLMARPRHRTAMMFIGRPARNCEKRIIFYDYLSSKLQDTNQAPVMFVAVALLVRKSGSASRLNMTLPQVLIAKVRHRMEMMFIGRPAIA